MSCEFKAVHRVEFSDTDMAGIMHFASVFRFMEATEHAFFRSLGFSICTTLPEGQFGWPRVHVSCDYTQPLRFEDEVEVHLLVREKKRVSLTYEFIFRKLGGAPLEAARGRLTVVCVRMDGHSGKMKAVPIPDPIDEQIQVAPAELFGTG